MAKANQQVILGIDHEIFDEETDVAETFHVVRYVSLDLVNHNHTVAVDSYARQRTYERGGRAVGSQQFSLSGQLPRGVDLLDWVYQAIVAPVREGETDAYGQPATGNVFTGAKLVYAALPEQAAAE
ncbi:hypothetical protein [Neisseria musculi]|uniref:Phage associated protein n=2 Tax=Neisseria musculi TaxID=1815583 RepID=A0A7H1ME50_9NEIS|nr:hypothetical protein [Neisseria musculi]QNT59915.1 hypothetical protein H7A79_1613 [Neisseria musculi]